MKYETINFPSGKKLLFSNKNMNGQILKEFIISDLIPCADPAYENYFNTPFKLDSIFNKDKCDSQVAEYKYDNRFTKIDTSNFLNLIVDNKIYSEFKIYPFYDFSIHNHVTTLFQRNFIGLNPTCLNEIKNSNLDKEIIRELSNIIPNSYAYGSSTFILGLLIIISGLSFISFVMNILNHKGYDKDWKCSAYYIFILLIFPTIILIIVLSLIIGNVESYSDNIDFLLRPECVDDITYKAARDFFPFLKSYKLTAIFGLIFSIFTLLPLLIRILTEERLELSRRSRRR
jgi:hypothetical protein